MNSIGQVFVLVEELFHYFESLFFSGCLFEFDVVEYSNLTGHLFVCGRHSIIDSPQTYQVSR